MSKIFTVNLYYITHGQGERDFKLIIEADDIEQAVRNAVLFYEGRQATDRLVASDFPDYQPRWGHYLGCIKAHGWAPDRIDEKGQISTASPAMLELAGAGYFEWKCDYPGELEDWIVAKCRKT